MTAPAQAKPTPTGRMWPVAPGDWHHAPDHLVAMVAQWYGQIRRVTDQIWSTAWLAGSADVISQLPAPTHCVRGARPARRSGRCGPKPATPAG